MRSSVLGHHSEPTDPELIEWIVHTIDSVAGEAWWAMVVGIIVVAGGIPLSLAYLARRGRGSKR